jgi:hypothetical protein
MGVQEGWREGFGCGCGCDLYRGCREFSGRDRRGCSYGDFQVDLQGDSRHGSRTDSRQDSDRDFSGDPALQSRNNVVSATMFPILGSVLMSPSYRQPPMHADSRREESSGS